MKSRAGINWDDSARKEPGRRPCAGPFPQCLAIDCEFQRKEPRSSLAPPPDANVNLIEPPEDRISQSRFLPEMHSRCSNTGRFHSPFIQCFEIVVDCSYNGGMNRDRVVDDSGRTWQFVRFEASSSCGLWELRRRG
jgi:hypothetical protein